MYILVNILFSADSVICSRMSGYCDSVICSRMSGYCDSVMCSRMFGYCNLCKRNL